MKYTMISIRSVINVPGRKHGRMNGVVKRGRTTNNHHHTCARVPLELNMEPLIITQVHTLLHVGEHLILDVLELLLNLRQPNQLMQFKKKPSPSFGIDPARKALLPLSHHIGSLTYRYFYLGHRHRNPLKMRHRGYRYQSPFAWLRIRPCL